jgi:hypothetical protein
MWLQLQQAQRALELGTAGECAESLQLPQARQERDHGAREVYSQPQPNTNVLTIVRQGSGSSRGSGSGGDSGDSGAGAGPGSGGACTLTAQDLTESMHARSAGGSVPGRSGAAQAVETQLELGPVTRASSRSDSPRRAPTASRLPGSRRSPARSQRAPATDEAAALRERVAQADRVMGEMERELRAQAAENLAMRERLAAAARAVQQQEPREQGQGQRTPDEAPGPIQLVVRVVAPGGCGGGSLAGAGDSCGCEHATRAQQLAAQVRSLQARLTRARAAVAPLPPPAGGISVAGGGGAAVQAPDCPRCEHRGSSAALARAGPRRGTLQCARLDFSALAAAGSWDAERAGPTTSAGVPETGAPHQQHGHAGALHGRRSQRPLGARARSAAAGEARAGATGRACTARAGSDAHELCPALRLVTVRGVSPPRSPLHAPGTAVLPAAGPTAPLPAGSTPPGAWDEAWSVILQACAHAAPTAAIGECLTVRSCRGAAGAGGAPAGQASFAGAGAASPGRGAAARPGAAAVPRLDLSRVRRL